LEKINIKIDLSIVTHDGVAEHPFVNIGLNGHPQFGEVCDKDTVVEFDVKIEEGTENFLTIEYHNKDAKQDVVLDEDNMPIKDKRVEINSISLDDINLELHYLDELSYECFEDAGWNSTGFDATKLSWNGRTTLRFTTPVYIWLLENL
tara:strand:- start:71 stop:514 length:444 start_codon:yes stop_codon:yes gene_type:complete